MVWFNSIEQVCKTFGNDEKVKCNNCFYFRNGREHKFGYHVFFTGECWYEREGVEVKGDAFCHNFIYYKEDE